MKRLLRASSVREGAMFQCFARAGSMWVQSIALWHFLTLVFSKVTSLISSEYASADLVFPCQYMDVIESGLICHFNTDFMVWVRSVDSEQETYDDISSLPPPPPPPPKPRGKDHSVRFG